MSSGTLYRVALVRTDVSEELLRYRYRGGVIQGAVFAVHCKAYPRYELGRLKILFTLKMEAICSSEASVLTGATRHKVP
jgi:hypothetical protein